MYGVFVGEPSKHAHTIDDPHLLLRIFFSLLLPQRIVLVLIVVNRRTRLSLSLACLSVDEMECVATSVISIERINDR